MAGKATQPTVLLNFKPVCLAHLCQTFAVSSFACSLPLFLNYAPHGLPLGHLASPQLYANKRNFDILLSLIVTADLEDDVLGMCRDWLLGDRFHKLGNPNKIVRYL